VLKCPEYNTFLVEDACLMLLGYAKIIELAALAGNCAEIIVVVVPAPLGI
jgi:hypothetical protein